jgi:hypothetical protein
MPIKSFRVAAADNGFTLSYCEETKAPNDEGKSYSNTIYKDHEKVFTDAKSLLVDVAAVLSKMSKSSDGQTMNFKIEVESEGMES